jgi:hypothetical protein
MPCVGSTRYTDWGYIYASSVRSHRDRRLVYRGFAHYAHALGNTTLRRYGFLMLSDIAAQ